MKRKSKERNPLLVNLPLQAYPVTIRQNLIVTFSHVDNQHLIIGDDFVSNLNWAVLKSCVVDSDLLAPENLNDDRPNNAGTQRRIVEGIFRLKPNFIKTFRMMPKTTMVDKFFPKEELTLFNVTELRTSTGGTVFISVDRTHSLAIDTRYAIAFGLTQLWAVAGKSSVCFNAQTRENITAVVMPMVATYTVKDLNVAMSLFEGEE